MLNNSSELQMLKDDRDAWKSACYGWRKNATDLETRLDAAKKLIAGHEHEIVTLIARLQETEHLLALSREQNDKMAARLQIAQDRYIGAESQVADVQSERDDLNIRLIAAVGEFAQLKKVQEWISVEDRLPDSGELVLIAWHWSDNGKIHQSVTSRWPEETKLTDHDIDIDDRGEVIAAHWMHLPADPELPQPPAGDRSGV